MRSIVVRALVASLLAAGCVNDVAVTARPGQAPLPAASTPPAASASPAAPVVSIQLTVFAAASLQLPLEEARAAYEAANPGVTLNITLDSSAALEAQLEQGAYADVFLSADTANPRRLVDGGHAEGEPIPFAGNTLAIVVPADNPAGIVAWQDLARDGLRVIAAGEEVPITRYANQLIDNLAAQPEAPAGFADAYAANVVSREDNVKATIAKVQLGEGDAAIVYATDVFGSSGILSIAVPDVANVRATYAGVVVKVSDHVLGAESFLDWFAGPEGQAILERYGFLPPSS